MFLTDLSVKKTGDEWELLEPLRYASQFLDRIIEVPAGFRTDFASVPRLPLIFSIFGDSAHKAAVVHDYLYKTGKHPDGVGISRKFADAIFKEAVSCHHPQWKATLMWLGVRLGGGIYWNEEHKA